MKLSVVIPAYKQTDLTIVHIRECMNSSRIPDEIVVVNDFGDTTLKDRIAELPRKCPIVYGYIREELGFGYHASCNLGIWLSRGDFITLEDADHIPLRDAYKNAVALLEEKPELNRIGFRRQWVPILDTLTKPFEEWTPYGGLGSNAMVAMYRRELLLDTKGCNEEMLEYGWLAYSFKARMMKVGLIGAVVNGFYIVKDGSEQNIKRNMSKKNRELYKKDARHTHFHNSFGLLNFEFDVTRFV